MKLQNQSVPGGRRRRGALGRTLAVVACLAGGVLAPAASAEAPAAASPALLERGRELYALCQQCHGENGIGNPAALAPAIAGLPVWYVENQLKGFKAGYRGQQFHDIGGMRMRPMARWLKHDEDVKAAAAYVAAMPIVRPAPTLTGGNAEAGKARYAVCAACHGPDAAGNPLLNSPALNHASDWYLLTQLQNFKAGIRGTNPNDTIGKTMQPMAMTLTDEQAMKDVIAYIMTLGAQTAAK